MFTSLLFGAGALGVHLLIEAVLCMARRSQLSPRGSSGRESRGGARQGQGTGGPLLPPRHPLGGGARGLLELSKRFSKRGAQGRDKGEGNTVAVGTSLVVQGLRLCLPMQGTGVRSLVGELRSHMLQGS